MLYLGQVKKNTRKITIILFLIISIFPVDIYSQYDNSATMSLSVSIPAIALINFATDVNKTVTYTYSNITPNQIEQIITPNIGDATWLNYSSIVKEGTSNYITVNINYGSLPSDVELYLQIGPDVGAGGGNTGSPANFITLSYYPQIIISNIGSCFTGVGVRKGHQLRYIWKNSKGYDYELKYENGEQISVIYTITSTE